VTIAAEACLLLLHLEGRVLPDAPDRCSVPHGFVRALDRQDGPGVPLPSA